MTGPTYVPRAGWGPKLALDDPMPGPASELWLHWAVKAATADGAADMRAIEETGRQRFGIFSYSYCYHPPSRTWYEGAGHTIGAHTGGRNSRSLGLSIIAAPGADDMPHLVADTAWMIRRLIANGQLRPGTYPTGGHRELKATECPGDKAFSLIPQIRAAASGATIKEHPLMALTDAQQTELLDKTRAIHAVLVGPKAALTIVAKRIDELWREVITARSGGKGYLKRRLDALADQVAKLTKPEGR